MVVVVFYNWGWKEVLYQINTPELCSNCGKPLCVLKKRVFSVKLFCALPVFRLTRYSLVCADCGTENKISGKTARAYLKGGGVLYGPIGKSDQTDPCSMEGYPDTAETTIKDEVVAPERKSHLKRFQNFSDTSTNVSVYIDGKHKGELKSGGKIEVGADYGDHIVWLCNETTIKNNAYAQAGVWIEPSDSDAYIDFTYTNKITVNECR